MSNPTLESSIYQADCYSINTVLNLFFTRSLADLLRDTPVVVNCVNPGFCYSELGRELTGFQVQVMRVVRKIMARTTEKGSRQLIYAAVGSSADPGRLQGGYINLHKVDEPSDYVLGASGRKRQDKLWVRLLSLLLVDLAILSEFTGRFGRGAFEH
jgi:hypothetical protein